MKYLNQLALIFAICLVSDYLSLHLPLPSNVLSMFLVIILLSTRVLKESMLGQSADFLLKNVTFFFVPWGVSILRYTGLIHSIWWKLILINLVTLTLAFTVSGWTVTLIVSLQRRIGGKQ
jgi:holin-like protein